ncbi:MAG: hypothetical protein JW966_05050 [Anaerolineae bacterium]|nr:hypothetical protein [Anaerolineae bacterium]
MEPVQAFAILSLGAFVTVLVTALFYVFSVRPRLLEPVPLESVGMLDDAIQAELLEQRTIIERLNTALDDHTHQLEAAFGPQGTESGHKALADMLHVQTDTVESLRTLLGRQSGQLSQIGERLAGQSTTLGQVSHRLDQITTVDLPGIQAQVSEQKIRVEQLGGRLDQPADRDQLVVLVQHQAEKLVDIGARLDAWAATRNEIDGTVAEHARTLAELDRQMAVQLQIAQRLDTKVGEHTTMLVTAATEQREQAGALHRIAGQLGRLFPMLEGRFLAATYGDRLTDVKGIGPVYAGALRKAGIQTLQQLAAMTPEEVQAVIKRSIKAESWIEQAKALVAQREKMENLS